jgi:hypothetical protein
LRHLSFTVVKKKRQRREFSSPVRNVLIEHSVVLIRILDVNVGFVLQVSERSVAGSYIQRLAPMFDLPAEGEEVGWSAQKVANVHCMLQVGAMS